MIPRTISAGIAVALMATGTTLASTPGVAAGAAAAATTTPTAFAMSASGYGTKVRGGDIPANSDRTAFQSIGCTNLAGKSLNNYEAEVNLNPLTASAVRTDVKTTKQDGVVESYARSRIAEVRLGSGSAQTIRIKGIESVSRAFHNSTGFHAKTNSKIAAITTDLDGSGPLPEVNFPLRPTQGAPIDVLGLLRISLGESSTKQDGSSARASAYAIRIEVLLTETDVTLAHSQAQIHDGIVSGVFRGNAFGSRVNLADGTVTSKFTPFIKMPCQGTDGKIRHQDVAELNPNGLALRGLSAAQKSDQFANSAYGWEKGRVAKLRIGDPQDGIIVEGIQGQANVKFVRGEGITTNINGTHILDVRGVGGLEFGNDDEIRVPGVALLERNVVKRSPTGISVTALRVTLLDGSTAEINLGHAQVGFRTTNL